MDIISLSKANKVTKDKQQYHKETLGEHVEAHFKSLDERLDWLEGTASNSNLKELVNLLQTDAIMINTEFVGSVLQLTYTPLTHATEKKDYAPSGLYEKIFDFTGSYIETLAATLLLTAGTNQTVKVEYASSANGVDYEPFVIFDKANPPSSRYLHIRITFENNQVTTITYDYTTTLEVHERIQNNLLLKSKAEPMQVIPNLVEGGTTLSIKIDESKWRRIDKLSIE